MAATDIVKVQKKIVDATNGDTMGLEEPITLADFVAILPAAGAAVAGTQVIVTRTTAPAAAAVPFADLTAAANAFNAMRTALIASGVLVA
ncbi:hypothetical protein D3C87_725680 [compost metagenome]